MQKARWLAPFGNAAVSLPGTPSPDVWVTEMRRPDLGSENTLRAPRARNVSRTRRYIAFLRAINVGGRTVKMDRLRELFQALHFANVEPFIASGNVAFESASADPRGLERRIEKQLHESLGFEVATFVRTPAELAAALEHEAFPGAIDPAHTLSIGFLVKQPTAAACEALAGLNTPTDLFHVHRSELYLLRKTRISHSKVTAKHLESAGMPSTMRNVTTLRKLAENIPSGLAPDSFSGAPSRTTVGPLARQLRERGRCDSPVTMLCGSLSSRAGWFNTHSSSVR